MSGRIFERLDDALSDLRQQGWIAQSIEVTAADVEKMRLDLLEETGVWVKPDGVSSYRDVAIAVSAEAAIIARRDENTQRYTLPRRPRGCSAVAAAARGG